MADVLINAPPVPPVAPVKPGNLSVSVKHVGNGYIIDGAPQGRTVFLEKDAAWLLLRTTIAQHLGNVDDYPGNLSFYQVRKQKYDAAVIIYNRIKASITASNNTPIILLNALPFPY